MIAEMPVAEKPREKALLMGISSLSDSELLAIILQTGIHGKSAIALAYELIQKSGGLSNLLHAQYGDVDIKGIGKAKQLKIFAAFELGKRAVSYDKYQEKIMSARECAEKFGRDIGFKNQESMKLICLDFNHRFLKEEVFDQGDGDHLEGDVKRLVRNALSVSSYYVYLIHNHPSGQARPSQADLMSTKMALLSFNSVGIRLLDHLIMAGNNAYSIREKKTFDLNL